MVPTRSVGTIKVTPMLGAASGDKSTMNYGFTSIKGNDNEQQTN
jgi:hypothetical protein